MNENEEQTTGDREWISEARSLIAEWRHDLETAALMNEAYEAMVARAKQIEYAEWLEGQGDPDATQTMSLRRSADERQ